MPIYSYIDIFYGLKIFFFSVETQKATIVLFPRQKKWRASPPENMAGKRWRLLEIYVTHSAR
jgi:hypothetical protein